MLIPKYSPIIKQKIDQNRENLCHLDLFSGKIPAMEKAEIKSIADYLKNLDKERPEQVERYLPYHRQSARYTQSSGKKKQNIYSYSGSYSGN